MSRCTTVAALTLSLAWVGLAAPAAAQGVSCDGLRAQIDDKIKSSGVQRYSVTVEDAATPLSGGKVVGNCDRGARRIVYRRDGGGASAAAPSTAASSVAPAASARAPLQPVRTAPKASAILTECKDGRVVRGNCD